MNTTTKDRATVTRGGEFLVKDSDPTAIFVPEDFNEEQSMVRESVIDFIKNEIYPNDEKIQKQVGDINMEISRKLGELGIFSTHMPEELGGMDLDFNTNTAIGEEIGKGGGSYSVTYNAHTGIGMLPILYFGTEEQKQKYLPDLMTGEKMSAYCLTEPSSGSDALAAKTRADLSEDGTHYILNGQKMWISNAGFADVFTVFAQVDGDKFTAFIVERGTDGLSFGEEEKKMGIKGSSTRMVFLENCKVPVENVLGEIGKGHLIAFNALNTGRFKLGASVDGGCKKVVDLSAQYANEREQFGKPIAHFGAMKHKLGEMAIRTFVTDTITYRISGLISDKIKELKESGLTTAAAKLKAAHIYALESSILKVEGSEALDYCVDEGVQIHGGMGYSAESKVERAYRDSRINRIFEGTNEINRMVILNTLTKSAMNGEIDLVSPALAVQAELKEGAEIPFEYAGHYQTEATTVKGHKKLLLMLLGTAMKKVMDQEIDLKVEQEILMNLSDIIIDIFNTESLLMRVEKFKAEGQGSQDITVYEAILKTYIYDTNARVYKNALDAIASFIEEDQQDNYVAASRKYTKYPLQNVKEMRRRIADVIIEGNGYAL